MVMWGTQTTGDTWGRHMGFRHGFYHLQHVVLKPWDQVRSLREQMYMQEKWTRVILGKGNFQAPKDE